ncbi:hypothetical protein [Rudanella lutea]|uniref:hypothetical protein n=1 Tax=Rudanella lutea TaxID=451374 RepID=UPI000380CFBE|nr:hypothetical protein [Rudanella lutea]
MNDTPYYIYEKQLAIFNAMKPGQRIEVCLSMIEDGRQLVLDQLRYKHPEWTQGQLIAGLAERLYGKEFPADKMEAIRQSIISFHDTPA